MTRRRFIIPQPDEKVEVRDHTEHALRVRADDAMLEALAREHPERATEDWSEPGTKSPRRITAPSTGDIKSNMGG